MILRNLYKNFIFGTLACAMFAACSDEDYMPGGSAAGRGLTFVAECGDMLPQFVDPQDVASRAADPKDEEEKRINTLHVFFFDNATGELLQATDLGFNAYQYISSNILPVPDTDKAFEGALASGSIQIYALANLSGGTKFKTPYTPDGDMRGVSIEESPEDDPYVYEINNRTDLLDWVYCPGVAFRGRNPCKPSSKGRHAHDRRACHHRRRLRNQQKRGYPHESADGTCRHKCQA